MSFKKRGGLVAINIFHTRCTSKGKVYNVIIDGGNFDNVMSPKMVEKLGIKAYKHPCPYKLYWLLKESEIKVDKHCLTSFSIKLYR